MRSRAARSTGAKWSQSGPNSTNPSVPISPIGFGLPFGSNAPIT